MKNVLTIIALVLFTIATQAQTATLENHQVDEFTGNESKTTNWGKVKFAKFKVATYLIEGQEESFSALYTFTTIDKGCSGVNDNYVILLLADGSTIELKKDELPRLPTGKLYKRLLRDRYWEGRETGIV